MDIERTMEFMLARQAKFEARFDASIERSNRRLDRIERGLTHTQRELTRTQRVLSQTNRVVGKLAEAGVTLRSDIRRHEAWQKHHEMMMAEMEDKLNALIEIVDKQTRRNGH